MFTAAKNQPILVKSFKQKHAYFEEEISEQYQQFSTSPWLYKNLVV